MARKSSVAGLIVFCTTTILLYTNIAMVSSSNIGSLPKVPVSQRLNSRPNFLILFADDIGWGDLGNNWKPNKDVTPHLNQMAKEGMRLTDFHSGASVCTPSRAALLTGRLGLRTGVVGNFNPRSLYGLPLNETTVAAVLQKNGYTTGMIGKWHLGITKGYNPRSRGFDYYYGLPYSDDMGCVDVPDYNLPPDKPCAKNSSDVAYTESLLTGKYESIALPLFENYDIVEQPADLIQLGDHYGNKSAGFLKIVKYANKPFFLYIAFAHMHVPLAHAQRFANSTSLNTVYSDTLHEMDDIVGRIVQTLKELDLYDNTVTLFTGDNGPWEQKCQYSGNPGPFLGGWQRRNYGGSTAKATTWEAGHRMPTVVAWPNQIAPNQVSDALTSALDVFPTFLSLAGVQPPENRRYDGMDLSDFFMGKTKTAHSVLFYPNSGDTEPAGAIDTIRMGPYNIYWKTGGKISACDGSLAPLLQHDPPLVFDVVKDPAEDRLLTPQTLPGLHMIIAQATKLRNDLYENINSDNITVANYSTSTVVPCCDPTMFLCRCKRDGDPN